MSTNNRITCHFGVQGLLIALMYLTQVANVVAEEDTTPQHQASPTPIASTDLEPATVDTEEKAASPAVDSQRILEALLKAATRCTTPDCGGDTNKPSVMEALLLAAARCDEPGCEGELTRATGSQNSTSVLQALLAAAARCDEPGCEDQIVSQQSPPQSSMLAELIAAAARCNEPGCEGEIVALKTPARPSMLAQLLAAAARCDDPECAGELAQADGAQNSRSALQALLAAAARCDDPECAGELAQADGAQNSRSALQALLAAAARCDDPECLGEIVSQEAPAQSNTLAQLLAAAARCDSPDCFDEIVSQQSPTQQETLTNLLEQLQEGSRGGFFSGTPLDNTPLDPDTHKLPNIKPPTIGGGGSSHSGLTVVTPPYITADGRVFSGTGRSDYKARYVGRAQKRQIGKRWYWVSSYRDHYGTPSRVLIPPKYLPQQSRWQLASTSINPRTGRIEFLYRDQFGKTTRTNGGRAKLHYRGSDGRPYYHYNGKSVWAQGIAWNRPQQNHWQQNRPQHNQWQQQGQWQQQQSPVQLTPEGQIVNGILQAIIQNSRSNGAADSSEEQLVAEQEPGFEEGPEVDAPPVQPTNMLVSLLQAAARCNEPGCEDQIVAHQAPAKSSMLAQLLIAAARCDEPGCENEIVRQDTGTQSDMLVQLLQAAARCDEPGCEGE